MKKLMSVVKILLITLWPTIFLLVMGRIRSNINNNVFSTSNQSLYIWLVIAYIVSGFIFAFINVCLKKDFNRKDILFAHIAAAVLVVLISLPEALFLTRIYAMRVKSIWFGNGLLDFIPLVFGYTLCTAIRAIVLYKKQTD